MKPEMTHPQVVKQILILSGPLKWLIIWQSQTGLAYFPRGAGKMKTIGNMYHWTGSLVRIAFGVKGGADITGLLTLPNGHGIRVEIEVKVGKDGQSMQQRKFQKMIENMGGIYILARNPIVVIQSLEAIRAKY